MRFIETLALCATLISLPGRSVEIVIKADGTVEAPAKEEEKKPPELPNRGQLNIIAINSTGSDFVVGAEAQAFNLPFRKIVVQNRLNAHDSMTLGTLYDASPTTSFQFLVAEVWMMTPLVKSMSCEIKAPKAEDAEKPKEEKPKEPEKASEQAPADTAQLIAKKSIVFYFYVAPGQELPQCVIYADTI